MFFKKRSKNCQQSPMTPTPITIKKSKGARDFFLKLASPLNYKPQQLEIDQTPITPISQVFRTPALSDIKPPPAPAQYNLTADDIPQLILTPRISLLMHPKILEFEIDSFEQTSTPIRGETRKRRNAYESESIKHRSDDSVDSIFDNAYNSDVEDLGYYLKQVSGSISRPGSFSDKESSIFLTQADIEIFTKHDISNPKPPSDTFMESFLDVYEDQINEHTTNQQQLVDLEELQSEEEDNLSLNNQAGLEINDEIYQLELMLIKEKHNYMMKKQQRQIKHLQKLLNYQSQINQQLVNQMLVNNNNNNNYNNNSDNSDKLLPPFSMTYPHKKPNTNIDIDLYIDDNKSTVSSADSIMSRNLDIHNHNYQHIHNNGDDDGNNTVETRNCSSTPSLRSHLLNDYCKINC